MKYCYVVNGVIQKYNVNKPKVLVGKQEGEYLPLEDNMPTYDSTTHRLTGSTYTVEADKVVKSYTIEEIPAEEILERKQNEFESAVQNHLDSVAKETKWDNMQSARACAGILLNGTENDIEKSIHDDAVTLSRWYLKVWAYCYQELDKIKAGTREIPTVEAFIAELPAK